MDKILLNAGQRKISGRKVKKLRKEGILPGNIFGKKIKSAAVEVSAKEFEKVYEEAGETGLIALKLGSEERPVLIHNVQVHPKTDEPLHVDFFQVDLKEKVTADVPVELTGESPAEKQGLGTVILQLNEIEVEALPTDLPEKFEINIENLLEVDQAIYVKDMKVDKNKVEIKEDPEAIVAKVEPPQKEEVVAPPPAPAEGEVPAEGVTTEGQPAEAAPEQKATEGKQESNS